MKKLVVWALTASLALAPAVPAFAEEQKPRARAFFDPGTDISTPEKMAQEIERCASNNTNSRALCGELVRSFNEAFDDIDDVKDYKELADYFRNETRVVPCPRSPGVTRVGAVFGDKIDYIRRGLREAEHCFFDDSVKRYVAAGCGQWLPDDLPIFTANTDSPPFAEGDPSPSIAEQANRLAETAGRSGKQSSFMSGFDGKKVAKVAGGVAAGVALVWLLSKVLGAKQEVTVNTCVGPNCR